MNTNKKCWNTRHLDRRSITDWRYRWESTRPHWLKGKYKKNDWHFKCYYGRWFFFKGERVIARQHGTHRGFVGGYFDFMEFFRYCKSLKKLISKRKKRLVKKPKNFHDLVQFFTVYEYFKEDYYEMDANNNAGAVSVCSAGERKSEPDTSTRSCDDITKENGEP